MPLGVLGIHLVHLGATDFGMRWPIGGALRQWSQMTFKGQREKQATVSRCREGGKRVRMPNMSRMKTRRPKLLTRLHIESPCSNRSPHSLHCQEHPCVERQQDESHANSRNHKLIVQSQVDSQIWERSSSISSSKLTLRRDSSTIHSDVNMHGQFSTFNMIRKLGERHRDSYHADGSKP